MKKRLALTFAGLAIAAMALAGCSSTGSSGSPASGSSSSGSSKSVPAATGDDLAAGNTSLGNVVVDGKGHTVYLFTKDTANSGKSTCTGQCAAIWPAVTTASATPTVKGVTGKVGTITLADGTKQVTLNGWPLYTFASDSAAGDVSGQGVMGIWWAVSPAGSKITKAAAAKPSGGSSSSAGGGWS
jgi:predicted lipoprotein with Yx(FWY)xxD motif